MWCRGSGLYSQKSTLTTTTYKSHRLAASKDIFTSFCSTNLWQLHANSSKDASLHLVVLKAAQFHQLPHHDACSRCAQLDNADETDL
ncbi:unnamed protein product [Protopolystoma xenopodis]|uniref:Uncharacterized protein n=1 Tax=Protopolystoma xenopodis TaxID=117903 RepID=A0A3S5AWW4_9PLAT|nr:unnamed protein product [Protopolystoma xenopodis]